MSAYETKWEVMREALIILRRLQEGPADREALIKVVQVELPSSFRQPTADAQRRHFERVIAALRERLYVNIPWDRSLRMYVLQDFGPYFQQTLTPDQLLGLSSLLENFSDTNARFQRVIAPLLEQIRGRLTPEQRRALEKQHPVFQFQALNQSSNAHIEPAVWQAAQTAVTQHRLIRFDYLTIRHKQEDGHARTHTAEPYEIVFRDGHAYLQAYCREWRHPDGASGGGKWHLYRLDYIQSQNLVILPTVFSAELRSQRLITVRYKVAPAISQGNMAQHFEEMEIVGFDDEGWAEVVGKTTSEFDAYRTLLRLGNNCVVLEPDGVVEMMKTAVEGMSQLYERYHAGR